MLLQPFNGTLNTRIEYTKRISHGISSPLLWPKNVLIFGAMIPLTKLYQNFVGTDYFANMSGDFPFTIFECTTKKMSVFFECKYLLDSIVTWFQTHNVRGLCVDRIARDSFYFIISSTMPVFVCLDHRLTVKRSSHQWSISHSAQSTHKHSCFLIVKWPREIFFCDHSCCCKYVYLWCLFLKKGAIKNCFCETKGLAQRISLLCWHNEPSDHGQNDDDCCCSLTRFNIEPFNGFACAGHERV